MAIRVYTVDFFTKTISYIDHEDWYSSFEQGVLHNEKSVFFQQLLDILLNLDEGEYSFDFYFYVDESYLHLTIKNI